MTSEFEKSYHTEPAREATHEIESKSIELSDHELLRINSLKKEMAKLSGVNQGLFGAATKEYEAILTCRPPVESDPNITETVVLKSRKRDAKSKSKSPKSKPKKD